MSSELLGAVSDRIPFTAFSSDVSSSSDGDACIYSS